MVHPRTPDVVTRNAQSGRWDEKAMLGEVIREQQNRESPAFARIFVSASTRHVHIIISFPCLIWQSSAPTDETFVSYFTARQAAGVREDPMVQERPCAPLSNGVVTVQCVFQTGITSRTCKGV